MWVIEARLVKKDSNLMQHKVVDDYILMLVVKNHCCQLSRQQSAFGLA